MCVCVATHNVHSCIVHVYKVFRQLYFLNLKGDSMETKLAGNVCATQLHKYTNSKMDAIQVVY